VLVGLVPVIYVMLHHAELTGNLVLIVSVMIGLIIAFLTLRHEDKREQKNMMAYLLLTLVRWCSGLCTRWHRWDCRFLQ
jgi:hypothetical protein